MGRRMLLQQESKKKVTKIKEKTKNTPLTYDKVISEYHHIIRYMKHVSSRITNWTYAEDIKTTNTEVLMAIESKETRGTPVRTSFDMAVAT